VGPGATALTRTPNAARWSAAAFISTANARHLHAMKIMAWDMLGQFEKDGETFLLIVYPLSRSVIAAATAAR